VDATGRFAEFLAGNHLKMTRERRAILEEVLAVRGHFTADDLLRVFRRKMRQVARATLYRTLARLVESRLVHKIEIGEGQARYETMFGRHHHDHLICLECGRIVEFESREIERAQDEICRRKKFRMIEHTHQLRGHCADCSRRMKSRPGASPRR